jgi:uncharacterized protein (TIGR03435 family)
MKRHETKLDELLDRHLGLFKASSRENPAAAQGTILQKLRSQSEIAMEQESSHQVRPKSVWRLKFIAVGAAAILLLTVFLISIQRSERFDAHAIVESGDGKVLQVGERIDSGRIVSTNGAGATLILGDGSRVEMRAQSELVFERAADGVRIRLQKGNVIVNAAKQGGGHLYVQTKDVSVSVVGTVFFVNAEESGSRVGVVEGEVHVQQGKTVQKLFPGEQMVTMSSMPSSLVAEQIAWSASAPAHMEQLQRSTVIEPPPLQFDAAIVRPDPQPTGGGAALGPVVCRGVDGGDRLPSIPNTVFPSTAPLGRCVGRYVNLVSLIAYAYNVPQRNISGGPEWAGTAFGPLATFQIEAKAENPGAVTRDQLRQMLQSLLAERFQLKVRRETKQSPGYSLVVAKSGQKVRQWSGDDEPLEIHTGSSGGARGEAPSGGPKVVITGKTPMRDFAAFFRRCPQMEGRLVTDKTDLEGNYEFHLSLNWIPGPPPTPGVPFVPSCSPVYDPPLPKALEEQLGLHLEPGLIIPEEFIIIEHAEKPSDN